MALVLTVVVQTAMVAAEGIAVVVQVGVPVVREVVLEDVKLLALVAIVVGVVLVHATFTVDIVAVTVMPIHATAAVHIRVGRIARPDCTKKRATLVDHYMAHEEEELRVHGNLRLELLPLLPTQETSNKMYPGHGKQQTH